MATAETQLFESHFTVADVNQSKYDRVARITARSSPTENDPENVSLTLDINTDLYPLQKDEQFRLVLASTLNLDGTKDAEGKGWRDLSKGERTLADDYEYVCYGKVYRFEEGGEGKENNIHVFISFGGLLMYLDGPYRRLTGLRIDRVYLLMRK